MASLLGEIKRRKIFQVAAAYVVVAWLLVQVITAIEAPLNLPDWFDTAVIVLLGIGFPITMVMSWAFNLTSDGLVRDAGTSTPTVTGGRSIEQVLIGLLVVAVGWLLFQDMRPDSETMPTAAISSIVAPTGATAAAETATQPERLPNSIAILPFESMSPDPNDAFFARGIHEEILNKLFNLRDLNVIARTSVLQYEGAQRPITEIAEELNVETIMEGSVSYADNRVAVSAQLIDGMTGLHIWSDRYYGEIENVFEIQADIAMNIANALEAEFSAAEQARLTRDATESPEAYGLYLRALDPPADPNLTATERAVIQDEYLTRAIALDPKFAKAYAYRAEIFANRGRGSFLVDAGWEDRVREAASQALALDPDLASAYSAIAAIDHAFWRWSDAARGYERAYQLNPKEPSVLEAFATFKRDVGDYSGSVRLFNQLAALDPNTSRAQLGISYFYARDYEHALEIAERELQLTPASGTTHMRLGFVEIARKNFARGLNELALAEQLPIAGSTQFWRTAQLALAYKYAGKRDDVERLVTPALQAESSIPVGGAERVAVHIALDQYEDAFRELELVLANPVGQTLSLLGQIKANPFANPILDSPEWQALRDRIGAL